MIWRHFGGTCAITIGLLVPFAAGAEEVFEKPVRLAADGKTIDTGAAWGHSSPCMEDLDGDGLADLLLGDFSGKFHVYKNIGDAKQPVFKDAGLLQAGGKDAEVRIYCCVGGQPRFLDLDGDGIRDFISSSYDPGHCYLFRGLADHRFEPGVEVIDKAGVPVRSRVEQNQDYESFGSFFTPVDWDADGDLDILIGCFDGELKLRINEGDAKQAKFAAENQSLRAGDEPFKVERHCCPVIADWDGDGRWDIISGSDEGSVTWFRNIGMKTEPRFEQGEILVEKNATIGYNLLRWSEEEIAPGIRSQVEVVDFNGDGKLDLLVGDFCTTYEQRSDLTEAEKSQLKELIAEEEARVKKFREKRDALREEFAQKYPGDAIYSDEADKAWSKAYKELNNGAEFKDLERQEAAWTKRMRPFLAGTHGEGDRSFDLAKPHGYVWLYLRK